jgi:hypothetical protein
MIKVGILAPDLERQMELLKAYPEIVEKHFGPTLKRDVKTLAERIRPTIPVLSGKAQRTFASKVTGKGINLTGTVGWYKKNSPWYINIVEHGAKPHPLNKGVSIRNSNKRTALFNAHISNPNRVRVGGVPVKIGDRWVTMEAHPGFSKRGFMAAGYAAMGGLINADMAQASEGVVKELAIK